jgi:hypothetical protein
MKYAPPPFIRIFVARAEIDTPVKSVIRLPIVTMTSEVVSPTLPSIQPKRRYMTTPIIVNMLGVYTP